MTTGGGAPSMQQMFQEAQALEQKLIEAQEELGEARVEGDAGGGLVRATVTGVGDLVGLQISPQVIDPSDPETLADLVLAAVADANERAADLQQRVMGPLTQGFGGLAGEPPSGAPSLPGH